MTTPPELTVVLPSFNERNNIQPLLTLLERALTGISWEMIVVDDNSPDGTAQLVWSLGRQDPRVRCLLRVGRRGLSSACIEGMLAASAPHIAVMDADLQHDETLLPLMLRELQQGTTEIAVASRYMAGGSVGEWSGSRIAISRLATTLSRLILKSNLTDPMSGFFMVRRELLWQLVPKLTGKGFKILLDLFSASSHPLVYKEFPFQFRQRVHGDSKIDSLVIWEFLVLLLERTVGRFLPVNFLMFITVGAIGSLTHMAILALFYLQFGQPFMVAQSVAVLASMTQNFLLNNVLTYRDLRIKGFKIIWHLLVFYAACSIGGAINLILAKFLFDNAVPWWIAGLLGAVFGAVWNFATTSTLIWSKKG